MQVFITGTDTNIGKTLVSSWICLHTGYEYFKPIQTGSIEGTDSQMVADFSSCKVHREVYLYKDPLSPHLAASIENCPIDLKKIRLPEAENLVVEGAGGVLVPLSRDYLIADLIKYLDLPVILVASSRLGTINHTLLSLEALRTRNINVLGVVVSGQCNVPNCEAIECYGKTKVLAKLPFIENVNKNRLSEIPLTRELKEMLGIFV